MIKGTFVAAAVSALALLTVGTVCTGCGETGPYVWANEVNAPTTTANEADFRLRETDTVYVHVFNQDNLSTHERIRPDGKISVPTVGEVMARGRRPSELAKELEVKLKNMVVAPSVAVSVDQTAQILVSVLGEVKNAGTFTIDGNSGLLVALADAGGLNDFASSDRIFLVRKGLDRRIRFRLTDLEADKKSATFALQPGDVIVVE
jgi:polysaccharide export outer membrane protein